MTAISGGNLGNRKLNERGYTCCGKPRGCRMTHRGCAHLRHPWKRAMVFGDTDVRCQATRHNPDTNAVEQCVKQNGHIPPCECVAMNTRTSGVS